MLQWPWVDTIPSVNLWLCNSGHFIKNSGSKKDQRNLTYHVSLLVDHHAKVFKDVVDVNNVRLDQAATEKDLS